MGFGSGGAKAKTRSKSDLREPLLSKQTKRYNSIRAARLLRKSSSTEALRSHLGHCLMVSRHGLVKDSKVTPADGHGERAAPLQTGASAGRPSGETGRRQALRDA